LPETLLETLLDEEIQKEFRQGFRFIPNVRSSQDPKRPGSWPE
jgi:hypothetical protein